MPWPTSPTIGQTYQPAPPDGTTYVYRGGGRWDIQNPPSPASLSDYYTQAQEDAFHEALEAYADDAVATSEGTAAVTYVPLSQKGANNGVAELNSSGKVPADQLALTKSSVGLGDVDNTADADKPISSATQTALDGKAASSHTHAQSDVTGLSAALAAKLDAASYTAADVKAKVQSSQGPGSGYNADLLDNFHASAFVRTVNAVGPDGSGNVAVAVPSNLTRRINSGTLSGVPTLDLDLSAYASWSKLELIIEGMAPATDNVELYGRFSTDAGSSWLTSDYGYALHYSIAGDTSGYTLGSSSAAQFLLGSTSANQKWGNATGEQGLVRIEMAGMGNEASLPFARVSVDYVSMNGASGAITGNGHHRTPAAWNALRLFFSSGNIASGKWALYGTP